MSGQKITVLKFSFILKWPVSHVCPHCTWKDSLGICSLASGLHPTINDVTTSSHVKYRLHALTAHFRASLAKYINNQWRTAPRNAPESQINIAHANLFAIFCWLTVNQRSSSGLSLPILCQQRATRQALKERGQVHKETLSWWDQTSYPDVPTPHWAAL